jgi:uncharacterized protein
LWNSITGGNKKDNYQTLAASGIIILHFFYVKKQHFVFDSETLEIRTFEGTSQATNLKNSEKQEDPLSEEVFGSGKPNFAERVEILVNATQKCNLSCTYCFVDKGRFNYDFNRCDSLSPETAKSLIDVLPKKLPLVKHFCIHFYGGEPLLNLEAINKAVETALPMGNLFSFAITTNGTIATKEAITVLKRGKFNVILSIDGPDNIHDAHRRTRRGKPTHAKVLRFLKKIKSENLFVRGSSVVKKGWSLREACSYLNTLPIDAIKAQAVRLPPSNSIALRGIERRNYFCHLRQVGQETIDSISHDMYPKDDRFNNRVLQLLCKAKRESFCGAGIRTFGMSSDGTMLPCVLLAGKEDASLGKINEDGEWVGRGLLWAKKHKPRQECKGCWAFPLCGGGCPSMLSVCGEDECELVRANCEVALKIYASFLGKPQDLLVLSGAL